MSEIQLTDKYIQLNTFYKKRVAESLHHHKNRIYKIKHYYEENNRIYYTDINGITWRETEVKKILTLKEVEEKYIEHLL